MPLSGDDMAKLIQCKTCGGAVAKNAKTCPHCGAKINHFGIGKAFGCLILLVALYGVLYMISDLSTSTPKPVDLVTLENFEKINSSMSYTDVCKLFGKEGTLDSEVNIGDQQYVTRVYHWYNNTGIANCIVTFQGGKMTAKSQIGLK